MAFRVAALSSCVAGANGSGKSTFSTKSRDERVFVVDPDAIAREHGLSAIGAGAERSTLSGHAHRAMIADARAQGYRIELNYVGTSEVQIAVTIRSVNHGALWSGSRFRSALSLRPLWLAPRRDVAGTFPHPITTGDTARPPSSPPGKAAAPSRNRWPQSRAVFASSSGEGWATVGKVSIRSNGLQAFMTTLLL
jgi:hypothetical protein